MATHDDHARKVAHNQSLIRAVNERIEPLDALEVERVVEKNERYAVVEKLGEAGEIVRAQDPRSRPQGAGG